MGSGKEGSTKASAKDFVDSKIRNKATKLIPEKDRLTFSLLPHVRLGGMTA